METSSRHAGDKLETNSETKHGDENGENNGDKLRLHGDKIFTFTK